MEVVAGWLVADKQIPELLKTRPNNFFSLRRAELRFASCLLFVRRKPFFTPGRDLLLVRCV
jgi:hypothetical protein